MSGDMTALQSEDMMRWEANKMVNFDAISVADTILLSIDKLIENDFLQRPREHDRALD